MNAIIALLRHRTTDLRTIEPVCDALADCIPQLSPVAYGLGQRKPRSLSPKDKSPRSRHARRTGGTQPFPLPQAGARSYCSFHGWRWIRALAFSCKGRLCPSCANRRMEHPALFLTARVLPKAPYRQWTLSLPWRIRWTVATKPKLLSAALAVMQRRIFAWQRRAARRAGIAQPLCGSVTFIQRFDGQLRLYPHFHTLVPDGVFWRTADGSLDFTALPPPPDSEVVKLVLQIGRRIEALVAEATDEAIEADAVDALQLSLAEAAQPLHRSRWPMQADAVAPKRPRCAQVEGFRVAPGALAPGALTRSGRADFPHPAPPSSVSHVHQIWTRTVARGSGMLLSIAFICAQVLDRFWLRRLSHFHQWRVIQCTSFRMQRLLPLTP